LFKIPESTLVGQSFAIAGAEILSLASIFDPIVQALQINIQHIDVDLNFKIQT